MRASYVYRWILEDAQRQNRWEGKEDLTQTATYALIFPSTSEDQPIKVALLVSFFFVCPIGEQAKH